jgi:hypothetical protein
MMRFLLNLNPPETPSKASWPRSDPIVGNILTTAMVWSQMAAVGAGAIMPKRTLVNISRMFGMLGFMGGTLLFVRSCDLK